MASGDEWEVIKDQEAEEVPEAYYKIEENHLKPCALQVNDKKLFFCLKPHQSLPKEAKRYASNLSGRCNTCKGRMPIYAQLIGIDGKHMCFAEEIDDPNVRELRKMRNQIRSSDPADYQVVIIDEEFFEANPKEVGPFQHMHFVKEDVSATDLSERLKKLKNYLNGSFENRFQKLVDDPQSLKVIQDALPELVRPDHWRGVVSWAVDFVAKAEGKSWQELPLHKKFEVMIYAVLTGRVSEAIHLDLQQASNLVDFMEGAENSRALCAMMDDRSNPETYQVSRVADRLRENRVASLCTVTLMWGLDGAPYKSDLDIHTWVNGVELYYGVRTVGKCQLDFDANASTIEKNPAENISLNQTGTFTFCVNNFNNRDAANVPFKVIVRKSGKEVAEHEAIWPKSRKKGDKMVVCTVTVTPQDLQETSVEMSEAEQKKLLAKEAEWAKLFGEPKAFLASESQVELKAVLTDPKAAVAKGAQQVFEQLLRAKPQANKPSLAERCKLEKLEGFIEHVTSRNCRVEVLIRNFVPAYVTRLETATDVLKNQLAVNVFHRKFELPMAPRSDEPGTARLDETWNLAAKAVVRGFVQVNHQWFMVLENARLPKQEAWPLAGGMYPTNLKAEVHHHRSKWTSFHALVTPEASDVSNPLVGSMLVGFPKFHFLLDGKEVTVSA